MRRGACPRPGVGNFGAHSRGLSAAMCGALGWAMCEQPGRDRCAERERILCRGDVGGSREDLTILTELGAQQLSIGWAANVGGADVVVVDVRGSPR